MASVLLLGTFDTKGAEYRYARDRLAAYGCESVLVDVGIMRPAEFPVDVANAEVAAAVGESVEELASEGDRGRAVEAMAKGAAAVVRDLLAEGRVSALLALAGSGGSSIAVRAMQELPLGMPKTLVSTVVGGDTRPLLPGSDVVLIYPVVDLAGLNRVARRMIDSAAAAVAGMANAFEEVAWTSDGSVLGATMFGVTTPCVDAVRARLDGWGFETLVFNANGVGGEAMERLVESGRLTGVADLTTTELADRLVGGILPAGASRLRVAPRLGIPSVISLGALDMVNFGPPETVPERFQGRRLHRHNSAVTLMRTSSDECEALGEDIAQRLGGATASTIVLVPRRGLSALSGEGKPFHDPGADEALFGSLRDHADDSVAVEELDLHINDAGFAEAVAAHFNRIYQEWSKVRRS